MYKIFIGLAIFEALVSVPSTANADIVYTSVGMSCDWRDGSASIEIIYDENQVGHDVNTHSKKNIYPLGERSGASTEKKGACALNGGHTIAFAATQRALPKDDTLSLFLDGDPAGNFEMGYGEWIMRIRVQSTGGYLITYCPSKGHETTAIDQTCTNSKFVNRRWIAIDHNGGRK